MLFSDSGRPPGLPSFSHGINRHKKILAPSLASPAIHPQSNHDEDDHVAANDTLRCYGHTAKDEDEIIETFLAALADTEHPVLEIPAETPSIMEHLAGRNLDPTNEALSFINLLEESIIITGLLVRLNSSPCNCGLTSHIEDDAAVHFSSTRGEEEEFIPYSEPVMGAPSDNAYVPCIVEADPPSIKAPTHLLQSKQLSMMKVLEEQEISQFPLTLVSALSLQDANNDDEHVIAHLLVGLHNFKFTSPGLAATNEDHQLLQRTLNNGPTSLQVLIGVTYTQILVPCNRSSSLKNLITDSPITRDIDIPLLSTLDAASLQADGDPQFLTTKMPSMAWMDTSSFIAKNTDDVQVSSPDYMDIKGVFFGDAIALMFMLEACFLVVKEYVNAGDTLSVCGHLLNLAYVRVNLVNLNASKSSSSFRNEYDSTSTFMQV